MNVIGITRSPRFSPNMQDNDRKIMMKVKEQLNLQEVEVRIIDEDFWANNYIEGIDDQDNVVVFTMMRSGDALHKLENNVERGWIAINSPEGIRNAERKNIMQIMHDSDIPIPSTQILSQNDKFQFTAPCWIKKGEGWAQTSYDVQLAHSQIEADEKIRRLRAEYPGGSIVVSRHLQGDIVKFYGVQGSDFFFWKYPDLGKTKFGAELANGFPNGFMFDHRELKKVCDNIADKSHILVYGGDCIIESDGKFAIIDFNDWPSFSPCALTAAQAIANKITHLIKH